MRGQLSLEFLVFLLGVSMSLAVATRMYEQTALLYSDYRLWYLKRSAEHAVNMLLLGFPCETPNGIRIPGCVAGGVDKNALGLGDLHCRDSCGIIDGCSDTPGSSDAFSVAYDVCIGEWNSCTERSCVLEVWT